MIHARDEILLSEIYNLINSIWEKEELPDNWKECIIAPAYMKNDENGIVIVRYHFCRLHIEL
jgi:hypothetical protein